jgi:hypothetical protein
LGNSNHKLFRLPGSVKEFHESRFRLAYRASHGKISEHPLPHGSGIERPQILYHNRLKIRTAQRVTEIRKLEAVQAASRQRLEALFQSMLHRAFQGEL